MIEIVGGLIIFFIVIPIVLGIIFTIFGALFEGIGSVAEFTDDDAGPEIRIALILIGIFIGIMFVLTIPA